MEVIFIDPLFVVINKPSGLLSVPGRGPEMQDCVVNRFKALSP
jgi:tRNA pseudouridine32 synthase / 23S rRNA pseudouridine746 synthase